MKLPAGVRVIHGPGGQTWNRGGSLACLSSVRGAIGMAAAVISREVVASLTVGNGSAIATTGGAGSGGGTGRAWGAGAGGDAAAAGLGASTGGAASCATIADAGAGGVT